MEKFDRREGKEEKYFKAIENDLIDKEVYISSTFFFHLYVVDFFISF